LAQAGLAQPNTAFAGIRSTMLFANNVPDFANYLPESSANGIQVKTELADRVARSTSDLLAECVLEFEVDFLHVDVPKDLAGQSLKLKFRMNGITYWKSAPGKAVMDGKGQLCLSLKTAARTVFEGASRLDFELCKLGCFASSSAMASCQVPLKRALQTVNVGSTRATVWNLELRAMVTPNKVLGHLMVEVCIKTSKLQDVGGMKALKAVVVPAPLSASTGTPSPFQLAMERAFVEKAKKAQRNLQEAFDVAVRELPEGHARVAPLQSVRSSAVSQGPSLASLPEMPEDPDDEDESDEVLRESVGDTSLLESGVRRPSPPSKCDWRLGASRPPRRPGGGPSEEESAAGDCCVGSRGPGHGDTCRTHEYGLVIHTSL